MKSLNVKDPHDVILRPVLTEKAYEGFEDKKYVFEVDVRANKIEIRAAVEACFNVKVDRVNTLRTMGKIKRQGKTSGRTREIKKAYVTLKENSKSIEFFDGMAQ